MKHQITLLGGQILPVYIGVIERNPSIIHILYTKESVRLKTRLKNILSNRKIYSYQVDPYDYNSIQDHITNILCENENDSFELNLTSGTKLMALASQQVFKTLDCFSFYIDQKHNIIDLEKGKTEPIKATLNTKTFLSLSGHNSFSSLTLNSFTDNEKKLANQIFQLRKNKSGFSFLSKFLRSIKVDTEAKIFNFKNDKYTINWNNKHLIVKAPRFEIDSRGSHLFKILTTGLWWEIIVGDEISNWKMMREMHMSFAINSKKSNQEKNEIDILVNTGQNLFFIECKAGMVTQSDINKIKAVNKLYGGVSSKSILVSFYKPKYGLIEKCQDLDIDYFYVHEPSGKMNKLNNINVKLDRLLNRIEL